MLHLIKDISRWARKHKTTSRVIIVFSFASLTVLGIVAGQLLNESGVQLPYWFLIACILSCFLVAVFYPLRQDKNFSTKNSNRIYWKRKTGDLVLTACTYLMVLFIANQPQQAFRNSFFSSHVAASNAPGQQRDSTGRYYQQISHFSKSMKDEKGKLLKWKERKKMLKEQIRGIRKSDLSQGAKTALIILSVLVAVGLIIGVGALSCSISCGGSEALAIVVLVLGVSLVIVLLVHAIRKILNAKTKARALSVPTPD